MFGRMVEVGIIWFIGGAVECREQTTFKRFEAGIVQSCAANEIIECSIVSERLLCEDEVSVVIREKTFQALTADPISRLAYDKYICVALMLQSHCLEPKGMNAPELLPRLLHQIKRRGVTGRSKCYIAKLEQK